jgi:hypothetical protein
LRWQTRRDRKLTAMMHVEVKQSHGATSESAASGKTQNGDAAHQQVEDAIVAVITLALELEGQPEASRIASQRATSQWALAGRARVLRGS